REALELGESQSRLAGLAGWRSSPRFSEDERAALGLAEALVLAADYRSISEARNAAARHFNPAELAQLTFVCIAAAAWDRLELAGGARRPWAPCAPPGWRSGIRWVLRQPSSSASTPSTRPAEASLPEGL